MGAVLWQLLDWVIFGTYKYLDTHELKKIAKFAENNDTHTLSQEGILPQGWALQDVSNDSFVCYQNLSEYVGF